MLQFPHAISRASGPSTRIHDDSAHLIASCSKTTQSPISRTQLRRRSAQKNLRLGPSPSDHDATVERPPSSGLEKEAESTLGQEPARSQSWNSPSGLWLRKTTVIAALSIAAILLHLVLRFGFHTTAGTHQIPLLATLALGGLPLLY